ncbi:MAG: decaprenyl-phosphate phosphoribosyltransferase [Alphaproteobacteria bacterium]|nr:decaprenyl-phosphate phosphoribosyltransferase [Alphaproteobacteria bacterium]
MSTTDAQTRKVPLPLAAVKALRPKQWTKNAFVLAALVFSFEFLDPMQTLRALHGVAAFCLISSTGYLYNDIRDREADALHPRKRNRPIASGALPVSAAWGVMALTGLAGFGLAFALSPTFALVAALYFGTTLSYSFYFKHLVILDIMFLALGFLWRVVAGAVAIEVWISPWLLMCSGFLALFLGFNKRRGELVLLEDDAQNHRKNLSEYSPALLDEFQAITTSGTIICYALYTVLASPTPLLLATLPFPLYFIFRYIYLVQQKGEGGDPSVTVFQDRPILLAGILYGLTTVGILIYSAWESGSLKL